MLKLVAALLILGLVGTEAYVKRNYGIKCWVCDNARSHGECRAQGKLKACGWTEDACQTHVRHDNTGLYYIKGCKSSVSCKNNYVQNNRVAFWPVQCNLNRLHTVCRCCCGTSGCNMRQDGCWHEGVKPSCNGAHLQVDMVIVLDSSSSITPARWRMQLAFVSNFVRRFNVHPDAARIGIYRYNNEVDIVTEIELKDTTNVYKLERELYSIPYSGVGTLTGKALGYAVTDAFNVSSGNRPNIPDVLLLITDGVSQDNVVSARNELQAANIHFNGLGIKLEEGKIDAISQLSGDAGMSYTNWQGKSSHHLEKIIAKNIHLQHCMCGARELPEGVGLTCSDNSHVHGAGTVVGASCTYHCLNDTFFKLVGPNPATCGAGGNWDSPLPVCERRQCEPKPRLSPYMERECTDGFYYGSSCTYTCPSPAVKLHGRYNGSTSITLTSPDDCDQQVNVCCVPSECNALSLLDLVIIIDSSSSVGTFNWTQQLRFTKMLVEKFEVGPNNVRVGMFRWNAKIDTDSEVKLGDTTNITNLITQVEYLESKYDPNESGTWTGSAMMYTASNSLSEASGNRKGVMDLVFVLTDGKPSKVDTGVPGLKSKEGAFNYVAQAERELSSMGAINVAIGVGMDDEDGEATLQTIAGGNPNHYYKAKNFDALITDIDGIMTTVLEAACKNCVIEGYVPAVDAAGLMPAGDEEESAARMLEATDGLVELAEKTGVEVL